LTIYGTKATYVNGSEAALVYTSREPGAEPKRLTTAYPGTHKGDLIDSFVDAVQGGAPPEVPADDVLRAMAVSLAIDEAVRQGGPVQSRQFGLARSEESWQRCRRRETFLRRADDRRGRAARRFGRSFPARFSRTVLASTSSSRFSPGSPRPPSRSPPPRARRPCTWRTCTWGSDGGRSDRPTQSQRRHGARGRILRRAARLCRFRTADRKPSTSDAIEAWRDRTDAGPLGRSTTSACRSTWTA